MTNIFNILGYLKLNNDKDAIKYLINETDTPYCLNNDNYNGFEDEAIHYSDDVKSIESFSYREDKYTSKQFARLTILGKDLNKPGSNPYYVCKCDCDTIKSIFIGSILSGRSTSCGCARRECSSELGRKSFRDLSGQQFGLLKAIKPDQTKSSKHGMYWICECSCGNITSVQSSHLVNGDTKSCGCLTKNDLTNKHFGKLIAKFIDKELTSKTQKVYWVCECECGRIKSIQANSLVSGRTISCGCKHSNTTYDLVSKEYGIGYTKSGVMFLFDKEDFPLISQYTWTTNGDGYVIGRRRDSDHQLHIVYMHRLVMKITDPNLYIDHIHHNPADNRKSELRIATHIENCHNRQIKPSNKFNCNGVYYSKSRHKWIAQITFNGDTIYLGSYDNIDDAITSRKKAEEKIFGEFHYQGSISTDQIIQKSN